MCEIRCGSADSLFLFFDSVVQSFENGCRLASHLLRAKNMITQVSVPHKFLEHRTTISRGAFPSSVHAPTALCPEASIPQKDSAYLKKKKVS